MKREYISGEKNRSSFLAVVLLIEIVHSARTARRSLGWCLFSMGGRIYRGKKNNGAEKGRVAGARSCRESAANKSGYLRRKAVSPEFNCASVKGEAVVIAACLSARALGDQSRTGRN